MYKYKRALGDLRGRMKKILIPLTILIFLGTAFIYGQDDSSVDTILCKPCFNKADTGKREYYLCRDTNPFCPTNILYFGIGDTSDVKIVIYNLQGKRLRALLEESRAPGDYEAQWDGNDDNGQTALPGIFFASLEARNSKIIFKCVVKLFFLI